MSIFPVPNPSYADLFNAQIKAFANDPVYRAAAKSWAYYTLQAYDPRFGIQFNSPYVDWNEDTDGKRPSCQPVGRIIVDSSAEFLIGTQPRFTCPKNTDLEELLSEIVDANELDALFLPLARQAGNEGSVWVKFAWNPNVEERPISLSFYAPYEVKGYRDPLDTQNIYKIRLRLKYLNDADGKWYLYQEVWTAEARVTYRALVTEEEDDTGITKQFVNGEWPIERTEVNRFGCIPFKQIYNRRLAAETDGIGDLWDIYSLLDSVSHTFWLENRSNQWDGDPITAIINAESAPNNLFPGDLLHLRGVNVDLKRLVPENNLREWMAKYADDVERMALDATGADRINPAAITNMGKMTRAVMELIFHRSVKTALEKRRYWGKRGFEPFLEMMFLALSRLPEAVKRFPALGSVKQSDKAQYDVVVAWPPMFNTTQDERTAAIADLVTAVEADLLSWERAVEIAADLFGITDVATLKKELEKQKQEKADQAAQEQDNGNSVSSGGAKRSDTTGDAPN